MRQKPSLPFIAAILVSVFFIPLAASASTSFLGMTEGTGTHFAITDSDYLNISLDSSEPIDIRVESVPNTVTIAIAASSSATETVITINGFLPNTTYYKYSDNYHNLTALTTDGVGAYTYTQDMTTAHAIFIQPHKSTKFIRDNETGGDCTAFGQWNNITKTCTLTQNLPETIQIDSDGITLDGNNFILSGSHTGSGVFMNGRSGVTIKNLRIENFSYGVTVFNSWKSRIEDNDFTNNDYQGIVFFSSTANTVTRNTVSLLVPSTSRHQRFVLYQSHDNSFRDNIIVLNTRANTSGHQGILLFGSHGNHLTANSVSDAYQGMLLFDSSNNSFDMNTTANTYQGVLLFNSSNNVLHDNTIRESQNTGLTIFAPSTGNQVYNNNFLNNRTQVVNYAGTGNVFHLPMPDGGNYWDTFDAPSEGCTDNNTDGFCDAPYVFSGGRDYLPWTTQDGWKVFTDQSPTLSFATDTLEGLYEDDGIQDHKGAAGKTPFMFSAIYTDAQNRAPDHLSLHIFASSTGTTTIHEMRPDAYHASSTLHDGDYQNGEAYIAMSTFSKDAYTYFFTATTGTSVVRLPDANTFSFQTGYSNVAFFPGLEASRLYVRDPDCSFVNCENQLWEPNRNADVEKLYLASTTGESLDAGIYTRDIINEANIVSDPTGALDGNIYKNFKAFMNGQVVGGGLINEWKAIPYDWRFDYDVLLKDGRKVDDNIYYGLSGREHYILNELARLASTSDTGKVTIITHSNGGLLAKYLLATMEGNNNEQLKTFDKVIMVAAPQLGTPGAIEGLLHGDK